MRKIFLFAAALLFSTATALAQGGPGGGPGPGPTPSPWLTNGNVVYVNLNAAAPPAPLTGTMVQVSQSDGVVARYELDTVAAPAFITGTRVDGTRAVPTHVVAADELTSFNAYGYNGAALVGPVAAFRTYAAETFASGHQGSYARVATTLIGSTTLTDRLGIENDGGVTVPPTVTGGSKGAGTINASGLYVNGVAVTGAGITALTGDVTAAGPGSVPATVVQIQGKAVAGTTGTGNVVFSASPTFTGTIAGAAGNFSGTMVANLFSGSGASLTNIPNGALTNSSLTIGSTNVALGATATSISGLSLVAPALGAATATSINGNSVPSASDTVALLAATQTFTNKSIAASEVNSGTLALAQGGAAAVLTANNGGVVYSTASALSILNYPGSAGLCLLSGQPPTFGSCTGGASVTSIAGNSGAFTLGAGLTNSVNVLLIDAATNANFFAGTANKVLTASGVFAPEQAITFNASQALDFNTFIFGAVTLTGNITSLTCSNIKAGQAGQIRFIQDSTGSRTMASTWCSQFVWQGGVKGTLSTTPSVYDVLGYQCFSTTVCETWLLKAWS